MTEKKSFNFHPDPGPADRTDLDAGSPEAVVGRFVDIATDGYQNFGLWEHLGWSLFRVVVGFLFSAQ